MSIAEHPALGAILICDFSGFKVPEMVKRRPVVVISPKIAARAQLCTVIALSTTDPMPRMPYHCQLRFSPLLPEPWNNEFMWVKGDMVYSVGFHRLDLLRQGRRENGKRNYIIRCLSQDQITEVRKCFLRSIGLSALTKHL